MHKAFPILRVPHRLQRPWDIVHDFVQFSKDEEQHLQFHLVRLSRAVELLLEHRLLQLLLLPGPRHHGVGNGVLHLQPQRVHVAVEELLV